MEDVAVYGYITPLKVKIIIAFPLTDAVVRDVEVNMVCQLIMTLNWLFCLCSVQIFKALHMAYYSSISNPFLKLEDMTDLSLYNLTGGAKWKNFRHRVKEIAHIVANPGNTVS
jgi:hypothetical protein